MPTGLHLRRVFSFCWAGDTGVDDDEDSKFEPGSEAKKKRSLGCRRSPRVMDGPSFLSLCHLMASRVVSFGIWEDFALPRKATIRHFAKDQRTSVPSCPPAPRSLNPLSRRYFAPSHSAILFPSHYFPPLSTVHDDRLRGQHYQPKGSLRLENPNGLYRGCGDLKPRKVIKVFEAQKAKERKREEGLCPPSVHDPEHDSSEEETDEEETPFHPPLVPPIACEAR